MAEEQYIQVIIPLKLEWEPYYRLPEGMKVSVGDRVRVVFANAFYVAVVSAVQVQPALDPSRIVPIEGPEKDLSPVTPEEIAFWRKVAHYYLCPVGEVYKAAYPSAMNHKSRLRFPESQPLVPLSLTPQLEKEADTVRKAFKGGKPVLLTGGNQRKEIYLKLAQEVLQTGKSVLYLVPETGKSDSLDARVREAVPSALLYHGALTPGKKKLVAEVLRRGEPNLVLGTRSALFLPFRNLGLVVVDDEQALAYKQDAPAPRYQARESAIMLSLVHDCPVLLGSATPSLDSLYNAQCGRFTQVDLKENSDSCLGAELELIDTGAEYRKKGMAGSFSLKLLELIRQTLDTGEQVVIIGPRRSYASGQQVEEDILEFCPEARIALLDGTAEDQTHTLKAFSEGEFDILLGNPLTTSEFHSKKIGLMALVAADGILARQDFRADERALQLLQQFRNVCHRIAIQTRDPHHPVFIALQEGGDTSSRMLEERRIAGYPPFTRMIKLQLRDSSEKRIDFLSKELAGELKSLEVPVEGPYTPFYGHEVPVREIRLLLPRDKSLTAKKASLGKIVSSFEQSRKYPGHISIDVDPA